MLGKKLVTYLLINVDHYCILNVNTIYVYNVIERLRMLVVFCTLLFHTISMRMWVGVCFLNNSRILAFHGSSCIF